MYTTIFQSTMDNLEEMDAIVLPTALTMLAVMVGSCRMLVIPITCLIITAVVSFASIDGITHVTTILTATPSLMMSVFLAMSIDYSLFLLTRFRAEHAGYSEDTVRTSSEAMQRSVSTVLRTSGKVVLASGTTLAVCFCG